MPCLQDDRRTPGKRSWIQAVTAARFLHLSALDPVCKFTLAPDSETSISKRVIRDIQARQTCGQCCWAFPLHWPPPWNFPTQRLWCWQRRSSWHLGPALPPMAETLVLPALGVPVPVKSADLALALQAVDKHLQRALGVNDRHLLAPQ